MRKCDITITDFENNYRCTITIEVNYLQLKTILKSIDLDDFIDMQFNYFFIYLPFDAINFPKLLLSLIKYKILSVEDEFEDYNNRIVHIHPIVIFFPPNVYPIKEQLVSVMLLNQSIFRPFMDF